MYQARMYIKRFSPDRKKICVWDLMNNTILTRQRPENYAAKRYFYDTNKECLKQALEEIEKLYPDVAPILDTADEQFVEKALSREEADVSKILDLICNNHEALYDDVNMQKLIIFFMI